MQERFAFLIRSERRERAFKRSIVVLTMLTLVGLVAGTPAGRYGATVLNLRAHELLDRIVGLPPDRRLIDDRHRAERLRNAAAARESLAKVAAPGSAMDGFLRAVGMDASTAVIRWGNGNARSSSRRLSSSRTTSEPTSSSPTSGRSGPSACRSRRAWQSS